MLWPIKASVTQLHLQINFDDLFYQFLSLHLNIHVCCDSFYNCLRQAFLMRVSNIIMSEI